MEADRANSTERLREALVIACGKQKVWGRKPWLEDVPARNAYVSGLFKLCRRYAEQYYPNDWFILSAYYGLMKPDTQIADYDSRFKDHHDGRVSVKTLTGQCAVLLGPYESVASLAGAVYNQYLKKALRPDQLLRMPLASMGLFERMKWLKRETSGGHTPLKSNCPQE